MAAQTRRNVRTAITQPPYAHTAGEFESIVSSRRLTALGWKLQPVAKGRMVNSEDWRTPSFYDPDYEFEREWVKLDGDRIIARQGDATWCTDLGLEVTPKSPRMAGIAASIAALIPDNLSTLERGLLAKDIVLRWSRVLQKRAEKLRSQTATKIMNILDPL